MRRQSFIFGVGLLAATGAVALIAVYQWDLLVEPDVMVKRQVGQKDALRHWNRLSMRYLDDRSTETAFALLADVNDDGVLDDRDCRAIEAGVSEWMRVDDFECNGRSGVHDRTPWLDDDLQLVWVRLPADLADDATLHVVSDDAHYFEAFQSDWLDEYAPVQWPLRLADHPLFRRGIISVPLWLRAPRGTPVDRPLTVALELRDAGTGARQARLQLHVVDELGHPKYFAAVRDYLAERDRADTRRPRLFRESVECASSEDPNAYEMVHLVAMPHESTRMEVLETFYDTPFLQPRIKNIFAAARSRPAAHVIVNGNYFHVDTGASVPHGRSALGAVVHNGRISPATGRHWWFTYPNDGRPANAEWFYTSYGLVQEDDAPGLIALREEPREPNPYVPMVTRNGVETPVHMALGGINTIHNFIHSVCGRKSYVWLARVPGVDDREERRLVCLAMTDVNQSTSFCGGPAFREKLRGSGLTIDEGDPAHGIPPGRSDLAYFDGGASIAMAVNMDGVFEYPTYSARHEPRNRHVHVNNYVVFTVED